MPLCISLRSVLLAVWLCVLQAQPCFISIPMCNKALWTQIKLNSPERISYKNMILCLESNTVTMWVLCKKKSKSHKHVKDVLKISLIWAYFIFWLLFLTLKHCLIMYLSIAITLIMTGGFKLFLSFISNKLFLINYVSLWVLYQFPL